MDGKADKHGLIIQPIYLDPNVDFDTVKAPGFYYGGAPGPNAPAYTYAFSLEVIFHGAYGDGVTQKFTDFQRQNATFYRSYHTTGDAVWEPWAMRATLSEPWATNWDSGNFNPNGKNLLDNWDFRNPVNQRGQTTYTQGSGYTIDRWSVWAGGLDVPITLALNTGYITLAAQNGIYLAQSIENYRYLYDRIVTLSIMLRTGEIISQTGIVASTGYSLYKVFIDGNTWFQLNSTNGNGLYVEIHAGVGGLEIAAVKLELGTISTLANDPPMDYGTELLKCQRYQVVYYGPDAPFVPVTYTTWDTLTFQIFTPTNMRAIPILSGTGNFAVLLKNSLVFPPGFTFTVSYMYANSVWIVATKADHGLTDCCLDISGQVILDANL